MPPLRLLPDLEESLRSVPGIRAASVVTRPDATPTELHVLAAPGKPAKQVVRDVQSLALAQYDIDIDHRIVSVVQIGDDQVRPAQAGRPALAAVTVRTTGRDSEAQVVLTAEGVNLEGSAAGPAGSWHRHRLVAAATLDALGTLLGVPAAIETAHVVAGGGRDVALTVLTLAEARAGEVALGGSALVRSDAEDAVARSVLDALNRWLTR